jgi:tetratricopeptide (TPR) repeat protein
MTDSSVVHVSRWQAFRARWHFIRATFHRYWGNTGSGRIAHERAVEAFSRAIEIDPYFADAHMQRGILYWREIQNYHHAIRDMTRVLELDPDRAEALYHRALAYQARGDFDQAIADYERFLAVAGESVLRESAQIQLEGVRELRSAREGRRRR